jgi:hypothetical protein
LAGAGLLLTFDFAALADFRDDLLAVFLALALLALLVVFARGLTRFFAALAVRARGALRAVFALFFTVFFLRVATTNSFVAQIKIIWIICLKRKLYRVASASIPNTEKTSGFRSRL